MLVRRLAVLATLPAALLLSGCVIAVDRDDGDGHHAVTDVAKREAKNRAALASLPLGSAIAAVESQLGEPDFTEAWTQDGVELRVLRYRTHRSHADGDTTPDETTPLIFRDGQLAGIGEPAYARLLAD